VLVLNDGSLWQSMALHSVGIPSVLIPQRGTVSASALELALVLGNGASERGGASKGGVAGSSIFLAGMDLAVQDIRSHARPYGFDYLFFGVASRLRPLYSQYFTRSRDMKAGGSYDVYAAWFGNRLSSLPQRVFTLGGNHAVFEKGLPQASPVAVSQTGTKDYFQVVTLNSSPSERRRHAVETLMTALEQEQYAATLCAELAPLLFPGRSEVLPREIAQTLSALGSDRG
jgi:hypothetical protein